MTIKKLVDKYRNDIIIYKLLKDSALDSAKIHLSNLDSCCNVAMTKSEINSLYLLSCNDAEHFETLIKMCSRIINELNSIELLTN